MIKRKQIQGGGYAFMLGYDHTDHASTNTTSTEVLASILIPAGTLGNNDEIIINSLWSSTGGTGNKTMSIKLHTAANTGGTVFQSITTASASASIKDYSRIVEKNANNSQEGGPANATMFGVISSAVVTSSLNTSSDIYINFLSLKATGTDGFKLCNYSVQILRG